MNCYLLQFLWNYWTDGHCNITLTGLRWRDASDYRKLYELVLVILHFLILLVVLWCRFWIDWVGAFWCGWLLGGHFYCDASAGEMIPVGCNIRPGGGRLIGIGGGQCGLFRRDQFVDDLAMSPSLRPKCSSPPSSLWKASLEVKVGTEQRRPSLVELPSSFVRGKRLSELSTLGIGGPAKYFVEVHDEIQMASTLRYCQKHSLRHFILGKGSNCLFDDRGFDGCVILNSLNFLERHGNGVFRVGGGHSFNRLGVQCSKEGFTGLEFASGIPGTVGGAIYMNASANGQETAEVLRSVEILGANGEKIVHIKEQSCPAYGYRKSPYQSMMGSFVIVAATIELSFCLDAKQRLRAFLERRRQTQPVAERSAGCVFRNPGKGFQSAGALIEQAGLKGFSIGQAKVSELHANFLLNAGGARAADMLALIRAVKEQVYNEFGVLLIEEIVHIPYS